MLNSGVDMPPAVRADAYPTTLHSQNGFNILILTFINWDIIKFRWSIEGDISGYFEIDSGQIKTEFIFQPVKPNTFYSFTTQGCAKSIDGSTNYCSPPETIVIKSAYNPTGLKKFLFKNGVQLFTDNLSIRKSINETIFDISLRTLMGFNNNFLHPHIV